MERKQSAGDRVGQFDRRTLLKLTGSAAASTVAMSGVVAAKGGNGGGKSGGRGQTSDPVELDEPFTVSFKKYIDTNASCMSDRSEEVHYTRYYYEYCNIDVEPNNGERKTLCVRPGESDLDEDRVYEFRSKQECKAESSQFQHRFSFGPSNSRDDC